MSIPIEALRAAHIAQSHFQDSLLAVYLHGSAVVGGLRPNSDVDILVVVDRPMTQLSREELVAKLLAVSGRYPVVAGAAHPIELTVFLAGALADLAYPAPCEFLYGEWLRSVFEGGAISEPAPNPDFTLLLAQARQQARPLIGPDPAELLPLITAADIPRAIGEALPDLLGMVQGDERNVLLTLARMWHTLTTGDFVAKDIAAKWAISRLPAETAALMAVARDGYLGIGTADWEVDALETERAAQDLGRRVAALM
ncbi:MAG TPA: aminoglycoside adenylyltransferase domain-containing protein [Devosiaceae bacterium]|jgi:streptomycin 3"-adenylyltransferase